MSAAPPEQLVQPGPGLLSNGPLIAALLGFSTAQFLKFIITYVQTRKWEYTRLWGSGGMPSSHTAFVIALTTAVWIRDGGGSSTFAICVVIASVTAYDAAGVRWHSGRTASLLNALVGELPPEHPIQEHESAGRLRDQLGHTPEEVAGGALVGILIGIFVEGLIFKVILKQGI